VILTDPRGKTFDQQKATKLSRGENLIIICGHYEGVDERVRKHLIDEEISIGDFVLSGGEIAAMVIVDAVSRLLPGVLEKESANSEETFSAGLEKMKKVNSQKLLEYPQYTRPESFSGHKVPKVLLSGNHEKIIKWKKDSIKTKNE
jgi:tRNA (guanine37-N1)-methyltransferase